MENIQNIELSFVSNGKCNNLKKHLRYTTWLKIRKMAINYVEGKQHVWGRGLVTQAATEARKAPPVRWEGLIFPPSLPPSLPSPSLRLSISLCLSLSESRSLKLYLCLLVYYQSSAQRIAKQTAYNVTGPGYFGAGSRLWALGVLVLETRWLGFWFLHTWLLERILMCWLTDWSVLGVLLAVWVCHL